MTNSQHNVLSANWRDKAALDTENENLTAYGGTHL